MKIAVASSGQWLDSDVDYHTGRAACFIVYDTEQEDFKAIDNWECTECLHWAGLRSADILIKAGVSSIVVRHIGPNTFRSLTNAKIKVYYVDEIAVVRAIRMFRDGQLSEAQEPNCEGHPHLK